MFQFQASLLDVANVYQLAPRLWDFVLFTVAVSLITTQILEERFSKSKVFGGKSEKLAKTIGILLGLSFAFAMRLQNISFIGLAESGYFFFVFSALIGIVVYAWGTGSGWSKGKAGVWATIAAGVSGLLLGASSAGFYSNFMSFLMWTGIIILMAHLAKKTTNPMQQAAQSIPAAANAAANAARQAQNASNALEQVENARSAIVNSPTPVASSPDALCEERDGKWVPNAAGVSELSTIKEQIVLFTDFVRICGPAIRHGSTFRASLDEFLREYHESLSSVTQSKDKVDNINTPESYTLSGNVASLIAELEKLTDDVKILRGSQGILGSQGTTTNMVKLVEYIDRTITKLKTNIESLEQGLSQENAHSVIASIQGDFTGLKSRLANETDVREHLEKIHAAHQILENSTSSLAQLSPKIADLKTRYDALVAAQKAASGASSTGAGKSQQMPDNVRKLLEQLVTSLKTFEREDDGAKLALLARDINAWQVSPLIDLIKGVDNQVEAFFNRLSKALSDVAKDPTPTALRATVFHTDSSLGDFSIDNIIKSINEIINERGTP